MSPHETLVTETREWLDRARTDLAACDALIAAELTAEALFHAQQCAEKAMKAFLTWHQVPFKKTHDLDELKQACLPLATGATDQLATIERLSQYAWRFRYPGAPYSPEPTEAQDARHAAVLLLQVNGRSARIPIRRKRIAWRLRIADESVDALDLPDLVRRAYCNSHVGLGGRPWHCKIDLERR